MSNHSQLVGGSTVDRLLNCPGSYQAILKLPPQPESVSAFAEEGSFGHAVMDLLARKRMKDGKTHMKADAEKLLGQHIYDREVTEKHLDELIYPAIEQLQLLENTYFGGFKVVAVEASLAFPGLPAFGTADLLLQSASHVILADWKFGVGPVKAVYIDDDSERLNPQLMFYLAAAEATFPKLFKKRQPVVAIIQPRVDEPLTHANVHDGEVLQFVEDVERAVTNALGRDPTLNRGEHCKYCPAKAICPLWVGPIKELAKLGPKPDPRVEMVSKMPTQYGEYLAFAKNLTTDLAEFTKALDEQLKAYLEDGGYVPGYTLQAKTKLRKWVDAATVQSELTDLGFSLLEIYRKELVTFAAADKTAKRLGVKIPDRLRVTPPSDETVVVRSSEAIEPLDRPLAIEQFAASAALLSRKGVA